MNVRASTHCCDDRRSSAFAFVGLYFNDDIAVDNMYVYLLLRIVFVYSISIRNPQYPNCGPVFQISQRPQDSLFLPGMVRPAWQNDRLATAASYKSSDHN